MSREIKFRAWDFNNNEMIFPSVFCVIDGTSVFKLSPHHVENNYYKLIDEGRFSIDQFTGLKDKSGKDVYEEDIVKDSSTTFRIIFYKGRFDFERISGAFQHPYFGDNCSRMQVIGNIYENPELLN